MNQQLLMAVRSSLLTEDIESEPVVVTLLDDGRLTLCLDDGSRLELDYDEILALGTEELDGPAVRVAGGAGDGLDQERATSPRPGSTTPATSDQEAA